MPFVAPPCRALNLFKFTSGSFIKGNCRHLLVTYMYLIAEKLAVCFLLKVTVKMGILALLHCHLIFQTDHVKHVSSLLLVPAFDLLVVAYDRRK